MALNLKYATQAQLGEIMRQRFKNASKAELYRLSAKIRRHLVAGDFTAAELRGLFGFSSTQWTALRDKVAGYADAYDVMQLAAGE